MTAVKRKKRFVQIWKFASGHTCILVHDGDHVFECFTQLEAWLVAKWCTPGEAWKVHNEIMSFHASIKIARTILGALKVEF